MLSLYGARHILTTQIVLVTGYSLGENAPPTRLELLRRYHEFLATLHPCVRLSLSQATQLPVIVDRGPLQIELLRAFALACSGDRVAYSVPNGEKGTDPKVRATVQAGLDDLARGWPDFRAIYETVMPLVLLANASGLAGGTASTVPGVLWAVPKRHWTEADLREFFLHEFVHMTLNLEERRFGFYIDMAVVQQPRYMAASAIRGDARHLDKVFHSIVVATELLLARLHWPNWSEGDRQLHPDTATMYASLERSFNELRGMPLDTVLQSRPIRDP